LKIVVRFSARALVGANSGIDLDASAACYRDALHAAIAAEYADAEIDVAEADGPALDVQVDGERHVAIERTITDLAWVVKQCAPWSVASS
jgi:hypothetical protein